MSSYEQPIHEILTYSVRYGQHQGWEFICPTCGYHARYVRHTLSGRQQLQVLSLGDPFARHTTSSEVSFPQPQVQVRTIDLSENDIDESWLTQEIRQQWEELLADVDMGAW